MLPTMLSGVGGIIDVTKIEGLISSLLATQLAGFYKAAGGKFPAMGEAQ